MNENPDELIPTRQTLLSRLKDWQDEDSWREFFETYWKLIYSIARKSGLHDTEAQEVVQETVIAISKQMPKFKYDPAQGSFKGWLLKLTQWRIGDQFRKRRNGMRFANEGVESGEFSVENIPDEGRMDLDELWEEEWKKNLMDSAIERVKKRADPKQYQLFDLAVFKEWPVLRIAKAMGVNPGKVYLAKHRVSVEIKKELQKLRKLTEET
jgi:RNA polymerase sigma factor (sigma-70 family)